MTVEELIVRLQIEEDNRGATKNLYNTENPNVAKVNMVELKKDFKKGKQPHTRSKLGPKGNISKNPNF